MNLNVKNEPEYRQPLGISSLSIHIAKEFSRYPGARYRKDGKYSGEEFREKLLRPRFEQALEQKQILFINLDDTAGYATSFLEEAFGGLARTFGSISVQEHLAFHSIDEPLLIQEIQTYIREANQR